MWLWLKLERESQNAKADFAGASAAISSASIARFSFSAERENWEISRRSISTIVSYPLLRHVLALEWVLGGARTRIRVAGLATMRLKTKNCRIKSLNLQNKKYLLEIFLNWLNTSKKPSLIDEKRRQPPSKTPSQNGYRCAVRVRAWRRDFFEFKEVLWCFSGAEALARRSNWTRDFLSLEAESKLDVDLLVQTSSWRISSTSRHLQ